VRGTGFRRRRLRDPAPRRAGVPRNWRRPAFSAMTSASRVRNAGKADLDVLVSPGV